MADLSLTVKDYDYCFKDTGGGKSCSGYSLSSGQSKEGLCCRFSKWGGIGSKKDGKCATLYNAAKSRYDEEKFDKYYEAFGQLINM